MLVHFVPSMPMLLNWLRPLVKRRKLPDTCMKHRAADSFDGKPAFAQTFFDQSAWTTMLPDWFPAIPRLPINLFAQQGCTYEGYSECESRMPVVIGLLLMPRQRARARVHCRLWCGRAL